MTATSELVVEFFAHMDAGDRTQWRDEPDRRPLTELGRRQSEHLAAALATRPIDAVFSGPALRCLQTLEPLATRLGLLPVVLNDLRAGDGFPAPPGFEGLEPTAGYGGAFIAGRALNALRHIQTLHPSGRVAVCTHGDVVPAVLALLAGLEDLKLSPLPAQRGGWHSFYFRDGRVDVVQNDVLPNFPNA